MKKTKKLLFLTFIFTVIQIALLALVTITLAFNLYGIVDEMNFILQNAVGKDFDIYSMHGNLPLEFILLTINHSVHRSLPLIIF